MKKPRLALILLMLIALVAFYFAGPSPESPVFDKAFPLVPAESGQLESYIAQQERAHRIKPDNEARIVWRDTSRSKTEYAVVYLHGFSASPKEGDPVHTRFANTFGCNLYLSRLADHGIDTTDALYYFTADRAWESAKQALAIGEQLGKKVILMSTSTGGTLALLLAAEYPDKVHALINLSPNIALKDPAAFVLNDPWGLQIARMVLGGKCRDTGAGEQDSRYWNGKYRIESLVQLEELLEATMRKETFEHITQPSLTLYYYKSEEEQDPQVKVSAMLEMHEQLATPDSLKVAKAMPLAGAHVLGCSMTSNDVQGVSSEIEKFAREKLHMAAYRHLAHEKK